jgi:hypothetical protein
MLLATVAGLVGSLDDRTGAFLVTTTATVSAVGILLAGYLQRVRHPTPPRRRAHSAPAANASREEAVNVEEMPPLSPAVSDAFASGTTDPAPLDDSPVVAETTDSGSWQLDDRAAGNGSDDADLAEREEHQAVGQVAPATHSTEATPSRPDDDDPPSGHS